MPVGPGKYDALCTKVRLEAKARAAIVIVLDGELGSGFSCQAEIGVVISLPELLESVARQIRETEGPPQ